MTDVGSLLRASNFRDITIYKEKITLEYPSMLDLMKDLQLMGESNATYTM
jgi:hypothetical protein